MAKNTSKSTKGSKKTLAKPAATKAKATGKAKPSAQPIKKASKAKPSKIKAKKPTTPTKSTPKKKAAPKPQTTKKSPPAQATTRAQKPATPPSNEISQLTAALNDARADARAARDEVARLNTEAYILRAKLDETLEQLDLERRAAEETSQRAEKAAETWRAQLEEANRQVLDAIEQASAVEPPQVITSIELIGTDSGLLEEIEIEAAPASEAEFAAEEALRRSNS